MCGFFSLRSFKKVDKSDSLCKYDFGNPPTHEGEV